jgi:hypothetical protein
LFIRRFYTNFSEVLNMTSTTFRSGSTGESIHFAVGECSLGSVLIAATVSGYRWGIERKRALLEREAWA